MDGVFEEEEEEVMVISRPPLLRKPPYIWLVITDGEENERQVFYNIAEKQCYVRYIPELKNKYVSWCQKGWLVVTDKSTRDCILLNILTMEKLQLPQLHIPLHQHHICVLSMSPSTDMDPSCRIVFLEGLSSMSCYYGDSEFVERELDIDRNLSNPIIKAVNFEGKLYALTSYGFHVLRFDFSDSQLRHFICVINGQSVFKSILLSGIEMRYHLVESCGDLLFVCISRVDSKVSDVRVYRADFSNEKWEMLQGIGDRAIFIQPNNTFSTDQASDYGLKANAVYWVNRRGKGLYMFDLEKKTLSTFLPCPNVGPNAYLFWISM